MSNKAFKVFVLEQNASYLFLRASKPLQRGFHLSVLACADAVEIAGKVDMRYIPVWQEAESLCTEKAIDDAWNLC